LIIASGDPTTVSEAVKCCKDRRPLILCPDTQNLDSFIKIAKENGLPLAVTVKDLDEASSVTQEVKTQGVSEIIINIAGKGLAERIQELTLLRRTALKKNYRPLGFPAMVFTDSEEPDAQMAEAVSYVAKYAGIVILKNTDKDFVFPVLVARGDIYQDPQKPVQVEPKVYEIGKAVEDSPVLVTTNFSITYFTVAGEVESSKIASRIVCCDSDGMSVLTAWAAEKFTAESITDMLKKSGIEGMVEHRKLIIPGYVSVMSGRLEEVSGWKVAVGPREASGIPNYLRSYKV
jgi:acetyl-CoA decarbonylase/synthase complex subunit gamma